MNKYLVTGGAGFIGSHLVERLLDSGNQVRVLDNLIYGDKAYVDSRAEFIEGDICDLQTCIRAMAGMDGVFHMAAMSRAAPSLDNIDLCTRVNIIGTQNILLASRAHGNKKVVYSGSSTFYGNNPPPHRENETRPDFLNFYSLSKYAGEEYALLFDRAFGVPVVVLRYFNVYGPRQPETGVYALVMGIFLKRTARGEPLEIHGDGSQRRDFIHVRDVVRANILAMESPVHGEIFNVGSGRNVSIKELADMISPLQTHKPRRAGDAEVTLADISRISRHLGWKPELALKDGLQELKEIAGVEN